MSFKLQRFLAHNHLVLWLVLTFITLICFDVISTALMSWGVFMTVREQDHKGLRVINLHNLHKWRIPAVVLRSGLLYYLVISGLQGIYSLVLNNYLTPLSTILASHFLLDLREVMAQHKDVTSIDQEMQFATPSITDNDSMAHTRTGMKPRQHFSLYKDFEFEMAAFSRTGEDWDSDLHLNSMSRPLEDSIEEEEGRTKVTN
ncbi:hypothetical protein L218DRAFT_451508 [Marasmius fiardii PR-910]|nr:hypothetical protein L218DRAFT_451508 [Marasmius fiardii PR-910]